MKEAIVWLYSHQVIDQTNIMLLQPFSIVAKVESTVNEHTIARLILEMIADDYLLVYLYNLYVYTVFEETQPCKYSQIERSDQGEW